jgi:hypothetical protein
MPDITAGYIRLFDLAGYWAHAGGIPHQMAFRRLCEWAACDAFPPGALVDRFERPIQPRDIYFDLETAMSGQWHAQNRLTEIIVRVSDLPAFCERTNTILPPPLLKGRFRRWWAARGGKQIVPPACPDTAEKFKLHYLPETPAEPAEPLQFGIGLRTTSVAAPPAAGRIGRPPGTGYRAADAPLIEAMRCAIEADSSLTPTAAARAVADRAIGGGTFMSKVERLADRYRDTYGG